VSIENVDRRQRKNLVVVSSKNFHIDNARTRFGCFESKRRITAMAAAKKKAAKKAPAKKAAKKKSKK
jgi:hypothetical protein